MSSVARELRELINKHKKLEEIRETFHKQLKDQEKSNEKSMLSHETILDQLVEMGKRLTRSEEEEKYKGFVILGGLTARIHADLHYAENEEEDKE